MSRTFNVSNKLFDGLSTKKTTGTVRKISVPQVDVNGNPLDSYINEQNHILTFDRTTVKHRGAYLGEFDIAGLIENQPTGNTDKQKLPAKMIRITDDLNLEVLPDNVRKSEKDNKIVDFNYDMDGRRNVYDPVKETWALEVSNAPTYFITKDSKGRELEESKRSIDFNKYQGFVKCGMAFVNAIAVDINGKNIKDSEGTYLVLGDYTHPYFNTPAAGAYGAKLSIAQYISVLANPGFGIIDLGELNDSAFPVGSCSISANQSNIRVLQSNTVYSAPNGDALPAFKVSNFKKKGTRKTVDTSDQEAVKVEQVDTVSAENFDF